jgi:DNA-binding transcriptional LysR family regulator
LDLEELHVLVAIAETGSLLAASERLKLTRTTVRRRIEALEARVGASLLFRGPSGAALTEAGEVMAARARPLLAEASALLSSAREVGDSAGGVLRVVLPVGLPPHGLTLIFTSLRAAHPRLSVEAAFSEDPLSALVDDIDLVLHFGDRLGSGAWVTRVVHPMRERIVASPTYLASRGTPCNPSELTGHDLLAWRRPGSDPRAWPTLTGSCVKVTPVLVASDIHSLRMMAVAGAGLAFLPDGRVPDPHVPDDALVPVLSDHIGRDCPLRMVVPEPRLRAPKVRKVLEEIAGFLADG